MQTINNETGNKVVAVLLLIVGALSAYWALEGAFNGYFDLGGLGDLAFACGALFTAWAAYRCDASKITTGFKVMAAALVLCAVDQLFRWFLSWPIMLNSFIVLAQVVLRLIAIAFAAKALSRERDDATHDANLAVGCIIASCALCLLVGPLAYTMLHGSVYGIGALTWIWQLCLLASIYLTLGANLSGRLNVNSSMWKMFATVKEPTTQDDGIRETSENEKQSEHKGQA